MTGEERAAQDIDDLTLDGDQTVRQGDGVSGATQAHGQEVVAVELVHGHGWGRLSSSSCSAMAPSTGGHARGRLTVESPRTQCPAILSRPPAHGRLSHDGNEGRAVTPSHQPTHREKTARTRPDRGYLLGLSPILGETGLMVASTWRWMRMPGKWIRMSAGRLPAGSPDHPLSHHQPPITYR